MNMIRKILQDEEKKEKYFILILLLGYLLVNGIVILHCEPWRDIAQAWLISRDLSIVQMFQQLKYEGHPCLWYLILMPFAKTGFPYMTIEFISLAFMGGATYLFLKYAPFSRGIRVLILCGSAFQYYLPTGARSYSVLAFLLMLLGAIYKSRHEKPIPYGIVLFLLCQTHVIILGFTGMLMLVWTIEEWNILRSNNKKFKEKKFDRKKLIAFLLMCAGVITVYLQLCSSISRNEAVKAKTFASTKDFIKEGFTTIYREIWNILAIRMNFNGGEILYSYFISIPLLLLLILGIYIWFRKTWKPALFFTTALLTQLAIKFLLYDLLTLCDCILIHTFIFSVWITIEELQESNTEIAVDYRNTKFYKTLMLLLLVMTITSWQGVSSSIQTECSAEGIGSSAKYVAEYINEYLPEDAVIIEDCEYICTAVGPYFPKGKIYNPGRDNYNTYTTWSGTTDGWSWYATLDEVLEQFDAHGPYNKDAIYLLISYSDAEKVEKASKGNKAKLEMNQYWTYGAEQYILYHVIVE